ncbi:MAG TPA: hypothetical protein VGI48_10195 [Caldimonas sp.]|jgi:hypothetical protein
MVSLWVKLILLVGAGGYFLLMGTPWLITGWGPVRPPTPRGGAHGLGPGHHDVGSQARVDGAFFVVLGVCCFIWAYRIYREYRDPPD